MIKCGQLAYPPPQTLYLTAVVTVVKALLPKWTTQHITDNNNPLLCNRTLKLIAPICTRVVSVQAPPAFPVPMLLGQQFQILRIFKTVKHVSHCAWLTVITNLSSRPTHVVTNA